MNRSWRFVLGCCRQSKGGKQMFDVSARALEQSGKSSLSKRDQSHKCCKRSNGGSEPKLTDAARYTR